MSEPTKYKSWYDDAQNLYNQGLNDTQIAAECGVVKSAVAFWRGKNNLAAQQRTFKKKDFAWHDVADKMHKEGACDREIAEALNIHISNIRRWRYRNNLPSHGAYITHGARRRNTTLYAVWNSMIFRCENIKAPNYERYGGRGITVCEEWHDPNKFIDWAMANGYQHGFQIDRINNNGNYEPGNCQWATPSENAKNRRTTVNLTVDGETKCASDWANILKVKSVKIHYLVSKYGKEYAENFIREELLNG